METAVRKFNENGLREFGYLLFKFKEKKNIDQTELDSLVSNDNYSDELDNADPLDPGDTDNKYTIARSISESLYLRSSKNLFYDQGLWSWLSAFMLDKLVPVKPGSGERIFRENALYIPEPGSWKRYYRHLLAFPCWIYSTFQDRGMIFLRGRIYERGEIVEQLASVQDIQGNPGILEAVTMLYYDPETDGIRKGAASKKTAGNVRRFRDVFQQFKMTYDLNAMASGQIINVLPAEFDKWKSITTTLKANGRE